jgi:hypothetical protein
MVNVKEIRILEPKVKEVKKKEPEKKEDEEESLEDEFLEEEFFDLGESESFQARPRPGLRRIISTVQQGANKNLEEKMSDVDSKKEDKDTEKKADFYKTNSSDFYGDSKNVYTGSGEQKEKRYDAAPLGNQSPEREDPQKKKYVLEERRDSNPLDNSPIKDKKRFTL